MKLTHNQAFFFSFKKCIATRCPTPEKGDTNCIKTYFHHSYWTYILAVENSQSIQYISIPIRKIMFLSKTGRVPDALQRLLSFSSSIHYYYTKQCNPLHTPLQNKYLTINFTNHSSLPALIVTNDWWCRASCVMLRIIFE